MSEPIDGTTVTYDQLAQLGCKVLNWVSIASTLGHTSLTGGLDYVTSDGSWETDFLLDFIRSCRARPETDAMERLNSFVQESGWQRTSLERMSDNLTPPGVSAA